MGFLSSLGGVLGKVMPIVSGIAGLIPNPVAQGISQIAGTVGNVINPENPATAGLPQLPANVAQGISNIAGTVGNVFNPNDPRSIGALMPSNIAKGITNAAGTVGNAVNQQLPVGTAAPTSGPIM